MFKNKIALITGSNRGIGLAIVKEFSKHGCNIISCVRKINNETEKQFEKIKSEFKNDIKVYEMELDKISSNQDILEKILLENEKIDVLVNNAGINHTALFFNDKNRKIREIFEVNFFSNLILTQKILKKMIKQKKGSIINIASNAAHESDPGRSGYAASKSALITLTKVLSRELGALGIRVNAVAPGLTQTRMMKDGLSDKILQETLNKIPLKRAATPEEIAKLVSFLGSDLSSYITGEVINITGGY